MVNAINGQGHGNISRVLPQSSLPSVTDETTEPAQDPSHPGKGKAGAPGQIAKEMLGGTPPEGFSLGNLVSLIAHNDTEGAQNLVNSLTSPPAEEPETGGEVEIVTDLPETTGPTIPLPTSDQNTIETVATVGNSEEAEELGMSSEETISLIPEATSDASLLDLFETPAEEDGTV